MSLSLKILPFDWLRGCIGDVIMAHNDRHSHMLYHALTAKGRKEKEPGAHSFKHYMKSCINVIQLTNGMYIKE